MVDASVAAKWFFDEVHSADALRFLTPANQLHAPDFVLLELDSLVCKRIRRSEITELEGTDLRKAFRALAIQLVPSAHVVDAGYEIAVETGRSLCDCLYLALAVAIDSTVVTADRRFHDALTGTDLEPYLTWVAAA